MTVGRLLITNNLKLCFIVEIKEYGEFGLIKHLTEKFPLKNKSSLYGVGDDCAVIDVDPSEGKTVVTTDLLLEGVHFDLTYCPMRHLGYKACVVNFSDVYAMMGTPRQITVSLGISKRFKVEDLDELYAGMKLACDIYGVDLVGGDTSASMTGLTISITCIGVANDPVYRNGAKVNDLICVSGDLGAAYVGLQLLEREKAVYYQEYNDWKRNGAQGTMPVFKPKFEGKEYLLERQLKPEARKDIVAKLKEAGIKPTSMMDISDGLSSELLHICHQSKVGCRIYEERIPIDYQTAVQAEEFNLNVSTCALNGGEDYELLFTVPLAQSELIQQISGIRLIGHITDERLGAAMITRDGNSEITLQAQGWNAFASSESKK
ncbi:MAG: thiamine-phosphate kinase [Bacteroidales bacterium]|nr:thiamine-phosphate kinase [Bacteroidales bacterium]